MRSAVFGTSLNGKRKQLNSHAMSFVAHSDVPEFVKFSFYW
jgi:hypothetical protein